MYTDHNLPPLTEQERNEAKCFKSLFVGDGAQFSIINDQGKSQAITVESIDDALLSHLFGFPFRLKVNKDGKPQGQYFKTRRGLLLGVSPIDDDQRARWLGFDLDGAGHKNGALVDVDAVKTEIIEKAAAQGLVSYWEVSKGGNGRHVWIFFSSPVDAFSARALGLLLAPTDAPIREGGFALPRKHKAIEIFPKQTRKTLAGNPLWLPGWIAAEAGRCELFDREGRRVDFVDVATNDPDNEIIEKAARAEYALIQEGIKQQSDKRSLVASLQVRGVEIKAGEAHPEAVAEINKYCKKFAGESGRQNAFAYFCAAASWVLGGWITEEAALSALLNACEINSSAGKWDLNERLRFWRNALSKAEPKVSWINDLYLGQLQANAEKESTTERKSNDEQRIAARAVIEDHLMGARNGISIVAADAGVGKTTAVATLRRDLKITGNGRVVLAVPTHDRARAAYKDAQEAGVEAVRYFSPASDRGLLDKDGNPVCKRNRDVLSAYRAQGKHGNSICVTCPHRDNCEAAKGYEGSSDPRLIITTHDGLRGLKKKGYLVIDELDKIYESRKCTKEDLRDLASEKGIFKNEHRFLHKAASALLESGSVEDFDGRLRDLAVEKKGVAPTQADPSSETDRKWYAGAWRAATWLLGRYLTPDALPPITDNDGFFEYVTPTQPVVSLRCGSGLALNGTPSKFMQQDLQRATCANVAVERFAVKSQRRHVKIWRPTTRGSRGRLIPLDSVDLDQLRPIVARIEYDLERSAPIKKVLLCTHQAVAKALQGSIGNTLRSIVELRGGTLSVIYWGSPAVRGSNDFIGYDAAYTIGDPLKGAGAYPEELKERTEEEEKALGSWREEEWQRSIEDASNELGQFFARLRFAASDKELRMVHLGLVCPVGWIAADIAIEYIQPGEKIVRDADASFYDGLQRLVDSLGVVKTCAATGICRATCYKLLQRKATPKKFMLDKVSELLGDSTILSNSENQKNQSSSPLSYHRSQNLSKTAQCKDFPAPKIETRSFQAPPPKVLSLIETIRAKTRTMTDQQRSEAVATFFSRVA